MKRRDNAFFRALGEIPQSYIDELTQWQSDHAPVSQKALSRQEQKSDEQHGQKERVIMKHTAQQSTDKNREAGISVRKLRPVTVGILASLTACAVIAAGFGTGLFGKGGISTQPANAPEPSEADPVVTEAEYSYSPSETEADMQQEETDPEGQEVDASPSEIEIDIPEPVIDMFGCYGDKTETGGIPEIPDNGAMLFTSMDDLRPLLERATNTDLPVKGVQHAESCFAEGRSVLVIKAAWTPNSYDHSLRSLYITADGYIHADIAGYLNEHHDPGLDPNILSHYYMFLGMPADIQQISGASVQQTLFISDSTADEDPLYQECSLNYEFGYQLKQLANNEADYIFPEMVYEYYTPEELDSSSSWMNGSLWAKMPDAGSGLPQFLSDQANSVVQEQLSKGGNAVIGTNSVQNGASPYISVYNSMADSSNPRRLVYPEQHYAEAMTSGTRMTILYSSELTQNAEMVQPFEELVNNDAYLPCSEGHASLLAIVNNP